MTLLKVSGIFKEGETVVLRDISFSQKRSQKIAIAGETGSGKSTLLKIIAGLAQPDAGEVIFEGERVMGPAETLVPGHHGISFLSQQFELPRFLRVEQVLAYANTLAEEEAETLYKVCQIDHLLKRKTDQLSGGERQRIAMARLLIASPRLLLLDEPFSNLDMVHKNTLKAVIHDIGEQLRITCILISHDPGDTLSWADEIIVMRNGQVVQQGAPEKIYRQPVDIYVAGLFGKYNLIPPASARILSGSRESGMKGRSIFVRPEQLVVDEEHQQRREQRQRRQLEAPGVNTVSGKVKQVIFFGSHYEIEVAIPETVVTLRSEKPVVGVGDDVHVSLSGDEFWMLP